MQTMDTGAMITETLSSLAASLMGLVYDNTCPVCRSRADRYTYFPICATCFESATGYQGPSCRQCARPFVSRYSEICGDCLSTPPPFQRSLSYGLYEGVLMQAIHLIKFGGIRRLAAPLAARLASLDLPHEADAIVPVPMTIRGLRKRGFNQAALMGHGLGRLKGIPLRLGLLEKIKEIPPQVGLNRAARLRNVKGAFMATKDAQGLNIILMDDVITTGATVRECALALKKAGAANITALSIARTY